MSKILLPEGYFYTEYDVASLGELRSRTNSAFEEIGRCKDKLRMMAIAAPSTIVPKGESAIEYITEKVDDIVDNILDQAEIVDNNEMYENCIEMWRHRSIEEEGEQNVNIDSEEGFNQVVINDSDNRVNYKEKYPDYFNLKNLDSVLDYVKTCVNTQEKKREPKDMWVVYIQDKLFIRFDGKYVFPSKEAAHKAIRNHLGIVDGHNIFTKHWISNNQGFIGDFLAHFDKERQERYRKYIDNIVQYSSYNMKEMEELWNALEELAWEKLEANGYKIRFVNIKENKQGETYQK